MSLVLVTKPTSEPVSVEDVKEHSRIVGSDEDAYILNLIKAARQYVEGYCKRALITQTWRLKLDDGLCDLEMPKGKLQSIDSINYIDTNGDSQLLSSSVYTVDADSDPARVVLAYGQSWPSTRDVINNVTIVFTCGYGEVQDVPKAIRQAILWQVDHWYEHRTTVSELRLETTPQHFVNVLWPHRINIF